ncbi:MAG: hypothetical protein WA895_13510 [Streptosporangiaceae bacterium]
MLGPLGLAAAAQPEQPLGDQQAMAAPATYKLAMLIANRLCRS